MSLPSQSRTVALTDYEAQRTIECLKTGQANDDTERMGWEANAGVACEVLEAARAKARDQPANDRSTQRRHRDEVWALRDRLAVMREALGEIVAAKNTVVHHEEEGNSLVLDAEGKMRAIAARALIEDVPA